ncbi:hypothetical protein ACFFRR_001388 [Megaselia abdita]
MIATEVKTHFGELKEEVNSVIEPIKLEVQKIEKDVAWIKEDNFHIQSIECRRDLILSGIPSNIRDSKALREIIIKIGSYYQIVVRPDEIFQCVRMKKDNQVLIKFGNLFTKEDIMKAYLRSKDLKLSHILDTNVESRVYLNNHFPHHIIRIILYCRRLK